MERDRLYAIVNVKLEKLVHGTLTGSRGSGGSKRTLEPAVLGSYSKPISRITYQKMSKQGTDSPSKLQNSASEYPKFLK